MATNKRVFTLRLSDEVFDKIGILATSEHRSLTNYIEYILIKHLEDVEKEHGEIRLKEKCKKSQNSTRAPVNCRFQKRIL